MSQHLSNSLIANPFPVKNRDPTQSPSFRDDIKLRSPKAIVGGQFLEKNSALAQFFFWIACHENKFPPTSGQSRAKNVWKLCKTILTNFGAFILFTGLASISQESPNGALKYCHEKQNLCKGPFTHGRDKKKIIKSVRVT